MGRVRRNFDREFKLVVVHVICESPLLENDCLVMKAELERQGMALASNSP
jgi:hypothetical protein